MLLAEKGLLGEPGDHGLPGSRGINGLKGIVGDIGEHGWPGEKGMFKKSFVYAKYCTDYMVIEKITLNSALQEIVAILDLPE